MNKIKTFMLLALTALAVASCSKDDLPGSSGNVTPEGRGIYLSFSDGADTRSTLQSSEVDYHDVKAVYLYVFEGTDGSATCVYDHTDLNVQWDQEGDISQKQWISVDLTDDKTYTFLAVGVDDKAGEVYGFPKNMKGETLSNVVAAYTGTDKAAMATAQLFAGYEEATVTDGKATVEITLRRKVAGVLAYLKNIPCSVEHADANLGEAKVTGLRIKLCSNQNTTMNLWPVSTDGAPVYGSVLLDNSDVLYEVDLAEAGYKPDGDGRYFEKAGIDTDDLKTVDNSLLTGAFMIPLENTTTNGTLQIELIGDYTTGGGEEYSGEVVKTYTITNNLDNATDFSIEENKLYSIGKKLSDASTDGDKPADLSGNILQLEVVEWCEHYIPNVFPTVTAPASIVCDYNPDKYIFDAPGTTFQITVYPSTSSKEGEQPSPWKLSIEYGDGENEPNNGLNKNETDWLHIMKKNAEGQTEEYSNTYENHGTDPVNLELVLNDFAVQRELEGTPGNYRYTDNDITMAKNDYRTAYIVVKTEGYTEPYRLKVRQYNTLTIYSGREAGDYWRGVARLDYGGSFDKKTGEAVYEITEYDDDAELGHTLNVYGYTGHLETVYYIFGDVGLDYLEDIPWEGERNTLDAFDYGSSSFASSAMGKLKKDIVYYATQEDGTVEGESTEGHIWYLPATQEMLDFRKYYRNNPTGFGGIANLGWTISYWTSTPIRSYAGASGPNNSWSVNITTDTNGDETRRNIRFAARPFRKFLDKDKLPTQ